MSQRPEPPKPAFTVTLSVGGCDWERVIQDLERETRHVAEYGPNCKSCWGGAGTHGHVHIERRDVSQEQYGAELQAWFHTPQDPPHAP